jgi:mono/diheme cytochrome c family protein
MRTTAKLASIVAAGALVALVGARAQADDAAAQKAFEANKCSNCHSIDKVGIKRKIQSEKMAGPDLSTIGAQHDAAWIEQWLQRKVKAADGTTHKSEYKGTAEDMKAISAWLASLK